MTPTEGRDRPLAIIVLAAGDSKRFKSKTPKVLHDLCGIPLIGHLLKGLEPLDARKTVLVVGRDAEEVTAASKKLTTKRLMSAVQEKRLGTADAARAGDEALGRFNGDVLIVPGDTPLLDAETLTTLLEHHRATQAAVTILSARFDDPTGYGRIVRDPDGRVARIVEHADATPAERVITECGTSVYVFDRAALRAALTKVEASNRQGELYLTDVIEILKDKGEPIEARLAPDAAVTLGVNSRAQLAHVSAVVKSRINTAHMEAGVTIEDPANTYIDATVSIKQDTVIRPLTFLRGATAIGESSEIGPSVQVIDSTIGNNVIVSNAVLRNVTLEDGATVGPFSSLRPGTHLKKRAKAGSFVEMKAATVGKRSKVPHLSYIGDAEIGEDANIGAGTITCNYDGETGKKSRTKIGDKVLIGSDTMLVAPVWVGRGAVTGAGSVVTKDVPPNQVVVGAPAKPVRKRKAGKPK